MSEVPGTESEAADSLSGQGDWNTFVSNPAKLVHPERIAACYDNVISREVAAKLQASSRVQQQLALLLMDHFALPELTEPASLDPADIQLMVRPADQISTLIPLAGAVYWAQFLASEIRTNEVAEIKRRIGEEAFQAALSNRDLAGNLPAPESLDTLEINLETDGYHCLASWHAALPAAVGAWARLKHANDRSLTPFPDAKQRALGAAIMRRLASHLDSSLPQEET
ncbi:type III secretion protein [Phyllobacterium sp. SB3]|uniref:type III secretion protein n=1 Tax=Phyllobacterium sp. SB3 TaxID=3156073 RepID=UPI0032AF845A